MSYFEKIVRRITNIGGAIGCLALLGAMIITVANIAYRMTGNIIAGTYELSEILMVMFVGFALAYAGLTKAHVFVKVIFEFFPQRLQAFFQGFTSVLGSMYWVLVVVASSELTIENARLGEKTDMLGISYIPFRWIFISGMALLSVILLLNFVNVLKGDAKK